VSKPITPTEALRAAVVERIPADVFKVFNALIRQKVVNGRAVIVQNDVVSLLVDLGHKRSDIFDNGWLDVESAYQAAGWKVTYDKPDYHSTAEPLFVFELIR
jgi:hypothetical protein